MILADFFRVTPKSRKVKLAKRKGVLFSNPSVVGKTIFHIGNWLLLIALGYAIYLYYPLGRAITLYFISQNFRKEEVAQEVPTVQTPTTEGYSLTIPKILASAKIIDNVSPFKRDEYLKVLENEVVAQAAETDAPGSGNGKMTYIFAHSTSEGINMVRKNAVFYLLGELKDGDVIFVNKNGVSYTYIVYMEKVVNASQTEYLKYSEPDKEVLILQTCWPIGTNWKRLLVFAKRV